MEFATIVFFEFIQGVDGNVCLLMCLHDCVFSNVIIPYSMNANKTNDSWLEILTCLFSPLLIDVFIH